MTNLLLLLSAMVSALIGAGPVARVTQAPVAVASAVQAPASVSIVRGIGGRPQSPLPTIAAPSGLGAIALLIVAVAIPAWKMRRRE